MMCDRCDELVDPRAAEEITVHGASGAGSTVYVHRVPCKVPRDRALSYPEPRRS